MAKCGRGCCKGTQNLGILALGTRKVDGNVNLSVRIHISSVELEFSTKIKKKQEILTLDVEC